MEFFHFFFFLFPRKNMHRSSQAIENRIVVLDKLLHDGFAKVDGHQNIYGPVLTRDGLIDALTVLYDECSCQNLMSNKHVADFVKKCK